MVIILHIVSYTTLIELNLNVPVEEQAEIICARWRENSQEVYDYIVRKLM